LLAARLDRLGEAREVAQIGAVLGRDFTYASLRAVGGIDDPTLQSALDKLADADLLISEGAGPQGSYRFKHALIQDGFCGVGRAGNSAWLEILPNVFFERRKPKDELPRPEWST
jgi:hypothetical protein